MIAAASQLPWITSRGAGIAALICACLSVSAGALIRSPASAAGSRTDLRTLHETLSLATLGFVALHAVALLADTWLKPGLAGVVVPFWGAYRPLWTGLGIIGGYGLMALGLSYYARDRIGPSRWKAAHRFTALFWLLGVVHALGAGTDARQPWFLLVFLLVTIPALAIVGARVLGTRAPVNRRAPNV